MLVPTPGGGIIGRHARTITGGRGSQVSATVMPLDEERLGLLFLVGAVVAEFYSSDSGLGYLIITSATQLRTDLLFVAIVVLAALGVSSFLLFGYLERKVTRGERTEEML